MTTGEAKTEERVFEIMGRVLGLPRESINADSSPDTLAGWDSLAHMNLVLALEEELGVQFTEAQIVEMLNAKLIVLAVEEARSNNR